MIIWIQNILYTYFKALVQHTFDVYKGCQSCNFIVFRCKYCHCVVSLKIYAVFLSIFVTWQTWGNLQFVTWMQVDEKTRQALFKLRQTWADIIPNKKLYALDLRVIQLDPAWPVTASTPEAGQVSSIHINPKFIKKVSMLLICQYHKFTSKTYPNH